MKISVQLQYLSNFCRYLEMLQINCEIHLELNWSEDCVTSTIADTAFKITNAMLYVTIVTLPSKDKVKLIKLLEKDLKDLFIGMSTRQKQKQDIQTITILQDFPLCLFPRS